MGLTVHGAIISGHGTKASTMLGTKERVLLNQLGKQDVLAARRNSKPIARRAPQHRDPADRLLRLLDEQHLAIGRQRPEIVGHNPFQLVGHLADFEHGRHHVVAEMLGLGQDVLGPYG